MRKFLWVGLALLAALLGPVGVAWGQGGDPPVDRFAAWWPACPPRDRPTLPAAVRHRLATAAEAYLAPDQAAAEEVARRLHFAPAAHPSNMCAPLAVAILRDAGVIQAPQDLSAYWLLDPRLHGQLLYHTFPPEKFCYRHFRQPPSRFDFTAFPLQAGDFLYLYAGRWGTFEHVLVVTRVDALGRVYAVSNLNLDPKGYYVVREVLLYDPQHPGEGMFARWADPQYADLGLTGFGGFDLWRPRPDAWGTTAATPDGPGGGLWPVSHPLPHVR